MEKKICAVMGARASECTRETGTFKKTKDLRKLVDVDELKTLATMSGKFIGGGLRGFLEPSKVLKPSTFCASISRLEEQYQVPLPCHPQN